MNLFDMFYKVEKIEEIDYSRMLILMGVLSNNNEESIKGITKLVKLDFFLRYPLYLEKSLKILRKKDEKIDIKEYERNSVESRMIRYKYGPWDPKYHKYINIMAAKGLLTIKLDKRTVNIRLTDKGYNLFEKSKNYNIFKDYCNRSEIIAKHLNKSGKYLKDFIYNNYPEITSLSYGDEI